MLSARFISFPRLSQVYFGVSFFGQLRTSEVVAQLKTSADDKSDNTRSHVQKVRVQGTRMRRTHSHAFTRIHCTRTHAQGIAVLSREPSFWWLHDSLLPAVEQLFGSKDFSRMRLLEEVRLWSAPCACFVVCGAPAVVSWC